MIQKILKYFCIYLVLFFSINSCGGEVGGPIFDEVTPSLNIVFPPEGASTVADKITIRGTLEGMGDEIAFVRVNGMDVTTEDNFANWQASFNILDGENTFIVEAEDGEGSRLSEERIVIGSRIFSLLQFLEVL